MANNLYRNEKELFKILNLADRRLTPKRFKKAIEGLTPSYDINLIVKKLKEIPVDEEDINPEEDQGQYPYPNPKKKKVGYPYPAAEDNSQPKMPPISNGMISISDLMQYLEQLAAFKKYPFSCERCKEILNSGNYIAYRKGAGFTPTIICQGSEILMSI